MFMHLTQHRRPERGETVAQRTTQGRRAHESSERRRAQGREERVEVPVL